MKKYCPGNDCKHADENGMIDTLFFDKNNTSYDGLQSICRDCKKVHNDNHERDPTTGMRKMDWLTKRTKELGGDIEDRNSPAWKNLYHDAKKDWGERRVVGFVSPQRQQYNIAPFSYPPEHEKRLRRDGGTTESAIIARKANRDDGFLYVMEHPAWAERKLGWTYNPPSRLSAFNVCCPRKEFTFPYISVYLEDARLAESIVQEALKEYHVSGEWYEVSRELAIKTIEDYVESLDDIRKKQKVG